MDERHLAQSSRDVDKIGVDTGPAKLATVKFGSGIVTDDSDVVAAQSPAPAGDQCSGHLAAKQDLRAQHFHLGAKGRELG
jgi:hypothetical protein